MKCELCQTRGKIWNGSEPKCFLEGWEDNWNCATLNAIREICYQWKDRKTRGVNYEYCDDMYFATIVTDGLLDGELGLCLYVEWYKSRGATDEMWVLGAGTPFRPNEKQLQAIIKKYSPTKTDKQDDWNEDMKRAHVLADNQTKV